MGGGIHKQQQGISVSRRSMKRHEEPKSRWDGRRVASQKWEVFWKEESEVEGRGVLWRHSANYYNSIYSV